MNHNYFKVVACMLLFFSGYSLTTAQSTAPEFIDCSPTPDSLCVQEQGVRLPLNNQLFLGEEHPDATSCTVHISSMKHVTSDCGSQLSYRVELFLNDTGQAIILQPETLVSMDSTGLATLFFDSEQAPDTLISLTGIPYHTECNAYHRIVWSVVDSCGQESSCTSYYYLFDCTIPVAVLHSTPFVITIPGGCDVNLFAKDYDLGALDDCTLRDQFDFSFNEEWHNPDTLIDCPEPFGVELPWRIWIADEGVDLDCDGQIEWGERNRAEQPFTIVFLDNGICDCGMETGYDISGNVMTETEQPIKGVKISLHAPGHVFPTYVTASDGKYFFNDVNTSDAIEIRAYKNDFHKNGVSTLDLVKIQKHLLGIEFLESPYKLIAGDANNSQYVSAIDLVEFRKLILGLYTELPNNQSWRFIRADYVFQDTMYPWPIEDPGTITITNLANPGNLDFIGIKIGDVNGTAQPNFTQLLPRNSLPPYELRTDQQTYHTGDIINVPIRISADQKLTGFQFTLNAKGMEIINIISGQVAVSEDHYALFTDKMTISWFDQNTVNISSNEELFTIQLRANESGTLSQSLSINSDITDAELYLSGDQTFLPVLAVENQNDDRLLEIVSCLPNPWTNQTLVHFYLPESDQVTFTLFDATGRQIWTSAENLIKGHQQYLIRSSDFSDRGMIFFEISTMKHKEVQKMIVLD